MNIIKPQRGLQLNKSHWASRGLVGYWLMNEGCGGSVADLSGHGNHGTFNNDVSWASGKFGSALYIGGDGDFVDVGDDIPEFGTGDFTIAGWVRLSSSVADANPCIIARGDTGSGEWMFRIYHATSSDRRLAFYGDAGNINLKAPEGSFTLDTWHHVAVVRRSGYMRLYQDGVELVGGSDSSNLSEIATSIRIGDAPADVRCWLGEIDCLSIHTRALTAYETTFLYRESFCMFDKTLPVEFVCSVSNVVELDGSVVAQSTAKGRLTVSCRAPHLDRFWLRDALFNGMTSEAFKLGTILSLGWFWMRIDGCTALYRGCSAEQIDLDNILAVAGPDTELINPPVYVSHETDTDYFYLVRRFNSIGYRENTIAAAVKVAVDSDGNLGEPRPNKIFDSYVTRMDANGIRIVWFYCPLEQKSEPACFKIYYDNGSGQIDFENPLTEIKYKGRRFYSYQNPQLSAGRYLFAVRAENTDGFENDSQARLEIKIDSSNPGSVEILEIRNI